MEIDEQRDVIRLETGERLLQAGRLGQIRLQHGCQSGVVAGDPTFAVHDQQPVVEVVHVGHNLAESLSALRLSEELHCPQPESAGNEHESHGERPYHDRRRSYHLGKGFTDLRLEIRDRGIGSDRGDGEQYDKQNCILPYAL